MKAILPIRLLCNPWQGESIRRTMKAFNEGYNEIASYAARIQNWDLLRLQEGLYYRPIEKGETYSLSNRFALNTNQIVSAIRKVVQSHQEDPSIIPTFPPFSIMELNVEDASWDVPGQILRVQTTSGPIAVKVRLEQLQEAGPGLQEGQAWLEKRAGGFYVMVMVDSEGPLPFDLTKLAPPLVGENRVWPFKQELPVVQGVQAQDPMLRGKYM